MCGAVDMKSEIQEKIQSVLEPCAFVTAAYLLGSACNGRLRPDSDIDLALLIGTGEPLSWERRIMIAGELEQALGRSVDIGVLDCGNLIYAHEAILKGECVFCRDTAARDAFAVRALGLYDDLRYSRREVEAAYACG